LRNELTKIDDPIENQTVFHIPHFQAEFQHSKPKRRELLVAGFGAFTDVVVEIVAICILPVVRSSSIILKRTAYIVIARWHWL